MQFQNPLSNESDGRPVIAIKETNHAIVFTHFLLYFQDTIPLSAVLLRWITSQLSSYEFITKIQDVSECFTNGQVLCCLINR